MFIIKANTSFIVNFIIFLLSSCSVNIGVHPIALSKEYPQKIAKGMLGPEATCLPNRNESKFLCVNYVSNAPDPTNKVDYFVYDLEERRIIYRGSIKKGDVKWYSNHEIELIEIPGIIQKGQETRDYIYILNLYTGQKVKKSKLEPKHKN